MKIVKSNVKKNFVKLEVNTLDDLWVLYNIISKGDVVSGKTYRKIEYASEKEKKFVFLKIETEKIEFHKTSNALRISGTIVESRMDEIPSGSHHTFTIQPGSLIKIEKEWKKFEIEKLKQAVANTLKPKVLLAVFEPGQADFALLRGYGLDHIGSLNEVIAGKKEIKERERSTEKFYNDLAKALEQLSSSNKIDKIIVGSIGIYNEDFSDSLKDKDIKDKISFCKISTIGKTGLNEMIKSGAIKRIVKDERISKETELVEKVLELISKNEPVTYGLKETEKAIEYGAVEILLITDKLISKFKQEDKFDSLDKIMSTTEKMKGKIEIVSSEHEGGKKLDNLGGIAALLRYKIS